MHQFLNMDLKLPISEVRFGLITVKLWKLRSPKQSWLVGFPLVSVFRACDPERAFRELERPLPSYSKDPGNQRTATRSLRSLCFTFIFPPSTKKVSPFPPHITFCISSGQTQLLYLPRTGKNSSTLPVQLTICYFKNFQQLKDRPDKCWSQLLGRTESTGLGAGKKEQRFQLAQLTASDMGPQPHLPCSSKPPCQRAS